MLRAACLFGAKLRQRINHLCSFEWTFNANPPKSSPPFFASMISRCLVSVFAYCHCDQIRNPMRRDPANGTAAVKPHQHLQNSTLGLRGERSECLDVRSVSGLPITNAKGSFWGPALKLILKPYCDPRILVLLQSRWCFYGVGCQQLRRLYPSLVGGRAC